MLTETVYLIALIATFVAYLLGRYFGHHGIADRLHALENRNTGLMDKVTALAADREAQKTRAEGLALQLEQETARSERQLVESKTETERQINTLQAEHAEDKRLAQAQYEKMLGEMKASYATRLAEQQTAFNEQLSAVKQQAEAQLAALREMNRQQVADQLSLIKEQMRTTSEDVLKTRQAELNAENNEQVSKIIDPLQHSLVEMQAALLHTKEQQQEAITRLDQTIRENIARNAALGATADRLTRALTGEVKVQGNFGEMKLRQLLEDLELKEGEQYDTQTTLRDKTGRSLKGDDDKGLIPDFILHFPNNRHVVVDSKMSFTAYERYMNADDDDPEKSAFLKAHLESVRAQVRRLAKKEYTRYLPPHYNRLNFAIMYVPIEGALNLALLNDTTLWREAYDQGVLILGPQTMYMNLRVLEMMWTQVRQLNNQQAMMDAANLVVERVQDFATRFADVEAGLHDTLRKIERLNTSTAASGPSIITAARNLLKAGAKENKKKKSLALADEPLFLDDEPSPENPS